MEPKATDAVHQAHFRAEKLRQELRAQVLQSLPGTPLLSENALARKYKVSRLTARRALEQLAQDKLIDRHSKIGSFVKGKRTITLLMPCPDFFDKKFFPTNQPYFRYFQGVMQATTEREMLLEMIAVSPTNNPLDIQYSLLDTLHAGSMVICSTWFNRLYEFLLAKNVRLAVFGTQHEEFGYQKYHQHFYSVNGDRRGAMRRVLDYFYACGKRRIALESPYLVKSSSGSSDTYALWCRERNLPVLRYSFPKFGSTCASIQKELMAELYRKDRFDVLIFQHFHITGTCGTIQETYGVPPDLPVFGFEFCAEYSPDLAPFPCCIAPREAMAREAVSMLDEVAPRGINRIISYDFYNLPPDWEEFNQTCSHSKQ